MIYNTKTQNVIGLLLFFLAVCWMGAVSAAEEMSHQEPVRDPKKTAAGVLPFFDDGKTILLGQEFRERYSSYAWMEFGGKQEENETLAETAWREGNEETAETLNISLHQVQKAEKDGHYVDHLNEKTGIFYRMYCLKFEEKPLPEVFRENAKGNDHVDKIDWQYFNASDVIWNQDGSLPGTEVNLYSTMLVRLEKLKGREFLKEFINPQVAAGEQG
jgi:8-oxo-dGTP pyrophosphatase MutT (NUDIX family)